MKPFDSLAPNAIPSMIRAPVTLQGFEMLPKGMTHGAGVWSAAPGMKSYEIPPLARSAAGALGERANRGAKSSGGCGCGGGCGPCGAKASLAGGASGTGGAGVVMRAPAALRGFEMLPQGMKPVGSMSSASAGMRPYEIPPNAKLAGQGLMGALRAPKAYEIMPRGGVAQGGKSGGCGCGGKCGPCGSMGVERYPIGTNILDRPLGEIIASGPIGPASLTPDPKLAPETTECDRINTEVRRLVGELRDLVMLRDVYWRWCEECRIPGLMPRACVAIDEAIRMAQVRQFQLQQAQRGFNTGQPEWWTINHELDLINDELNGPHNSGGGLLDTATTG